MKHNLITIALTLLVAMPLCAQSKHLQKSAYPSYKGLVMAGYQGWFHNPEKKMMFSDTTRTYIDAWPDVSEYSETYPTAFRHIGGESAEFFSSDDESTVDTHFRWMKEYGLDGVFMQRFFNSVKGTAKGKDLSVTVLRHAMKASKNIQGPSLSCTTFPALIQGRMTAQPSSRIGSIWWIPSR